MKIPTTPFLITVATIAYAITYLATAQAYPSHAMRIPELAQNLLLEAKVSSNLESYQKGLRGAADHMIYDIQQKDFVRDSQFHEYGVGFGQVLGVILEDDPAWWMAEWPKPVKANLIILSGVYDNQPQPETAWKIELRYNGQWMTHARGVGDWYDGSRYEWGGPETEVITFDAIRVSVFSKDDKTPIKSIHFRGEEGVSWVVTYYPPIDAKLKLPHWPVRTGQSVEFEAVESLGKIISWQWDFGDGKNASGRKVNHTYTKPGSYLVKLHFSDGTDTARRSGAITVIPPFRMRIKLLNGPVLVGEPANFEGYVDGEQVNEYVWSFGDGETARGKDVSHVFDKPGVYQVKLSVSDGTYPDECTTIVRVHTGETMKTNDKIAIWLDTDIGGDIDDAVCLLLAIRHPQIELVGVSTVRGCIGAVDVAAWLCREMLQRAGFSQIPVLPGAVASFSGSSYPSGVGSYGRLGPAPEPVSPEDDDSRLDAIADAMRRVGKPFHLVTIGPLTNAAWLVERHPEVAKQWETVTCMAGQLTDEPECNVGLDPDAARVVCEKLTPRLVGMEAIGPAIPREEADAALDSTDPASAFLQECYAVYRSQADWGGPEPERRPLTVFDPTTLLSVVQADAFDFKPVHLVVEKDGRFRLTDGGSPVSYAFSSDWDILKPLIIALLRGEDIGNLRPDQ